MSKNQSKENDNAAVNPMESTQRLEAIKNLIFGENIQQIDEEFQSIKNHVEKRKEELENLIDDTRKQLNSTIDNLATDLNIRITDLENHFNDKTDELNHKKVDRNLLGTLLVSLGEKIMKD
jgi:archaellum component FlaC